MPDVVLTYEDIDGGRIQSARLIAVPLFSITSIEHVLALKSRLHTLTPSSPRKLTDQMLRARNTEGDI
jgi:hypothetical protein